MNSTTTSGAPARELCTRTNDGIDVALLWLPAEDRLLVTVADRKLGDSFEIPVKAGDAMRVFRHPYPYAAELGVRDDEPSDDELIPEGSCPR